MGQYWPLYGCYKYLSTYLSIYLSLSLSTTIISPIPFYRHYLLLVLSTTISLILFHYHSFSCSFYCYLALVLIILHFSIFSSKRFMNLVRFLPSKMPTFKMTLLMDFSMLVDMLCSLIIHSIIAYNISVWSSICSLSHQNDFISPYRHFYKGFTKFS